MLISGLAALLALASPQVPLEGPTGQALTQCLVSHTSDADRTILIRWTFGAITAHPAVADLANVSDAQRTELTARAAALFERLITDDCRSQAVAVLKTEGSNGFGQSFRDFGAQSTGFLMQNPAVVRQVGGLVGHLVADPEFMQLILEAQAN